MSVLGKVRSALETSEYEFDYPFNGLLVTVDPERDDPERLGEYATAFSPDFLGITGSEKQLEDFARQLNVAFVKVPLDEEGDKDEDDDAGEGRTTGGGGEEADDASLGGGADILNRTCTRDEKRHRSYATTRATGTFDRSLKTCG